MLWLLIPQTLTFCETEWLTNISMITDHVNNIQYLPETGNALSSLVYTGFGLVGIIPKYQSPMYYLIMNLFIIMGITSFFHHYYYPNIRWALAADVISMEILVAFSLIYIISETSNIYINKILNLISLSLCLSMLVFFKTGYGPRTEIFKGLTFTIVATQIGICSYFFCIKSIIKYKILITSIWNVILFGGGVGFWYLDLSCPLWTWNRINGHAFWHTFIAWSLFNTINISCLFHAIIKKKDYSWKSLSNRIPWILFIIILKKDTSKNKYTELELSRITITTSQPKCHKRSSTIG